MKDGREIVDADRGGFIYGPTTGLHDNVGELDFSSLYPTLMRDMNLSGETVSCRCCPKSGQRVPEIGYNICGKTGIVPQSLDILLERRKGFKQLIRDARDKEVKQRFEKRQAELKWILVCSFGYLGFKNARFGKIDAHIATCAFSRAAIKQAVSIANDRDFTLVHGIVDSMWLTKPDATCTDYEKLSEQLRNELHVPLSFEGQYKWIVFLNSKTNPQSQVLNRYYGIFKDGTFKVRGIDLRRHDTPEIIRKCQNEMLSILQHAENSAEFKELIPKALCVVQKFVSRLRSSSVPLEELAITRKLSKDPGEYSHKVPQATAARLLQGTGGSIHAGQQVSYILTKDSYKKKDTSATALELADKSAVYDSQSYVDLLISSTVNLLLPFSFEKDRWPLHS